MIRNTLAKAISLAIAGGAITLAGVSNASASTTMYNTNKPITNGNPTDAAALSTDGWTRNNNGTNTGTPLPWLGTVGAVRPFGYEGLSIANWAAHVTAAGDSLEISQADAATRYGTAWGPVAGTTYLANIDTAKGAWFDGSTGWAHNTDIGLFKSDVTTEVSIRLTPLFNVSEPDKSWSNFGVTVFTGMDTDTSKATTPNYSHHAGWNETSFTADNPMGTTGLTYLTHDATVDATNALVFTAVAGQVYSIYLGGNSGEGNFNPHAGYRLNLSTAAPVPLPGAVWLFGSALVGLLGFGKRNSSKFSR
ncbi:hypothetical protein ACH5Y9_06235 [Methylomonas sp. BW4-1]|uniref:Secreted protein n=2 Tax=Methylomonas TaxID=416 RepID=A0ABU4UKK8_9GAMM|nr:MULTISPECIES: hypothetical protein [Methylomonas]MBD9363179.1 hypothetical protein [Methylomonas fluvii]MDX8129224.1 hypothetical protein [Methylomonas sp. OY6]CAD6876429.1 hypothetical protein [Methylomonas fluvii]